MRNDTIWKKKNLKSLPYLCISFLSRNSGIRILLFPFPLLLTTDSTVNSIKCKQPLFNTLIFYFPHIFLPLYLITSEKCSPFLHSIYKWSTNLNFMMMSVVLQRKRKPYVFKWNYIKNLCFKSLKLLSRFPFHNFQSLHWLVHFL